MAQTRFKFASGSPNDAPGLYHSCLTSERDISIRWWDGSLWWDISIDRGSKAMPFTWPSGNAKRGISVPSWYKRYDYKKSMCLRKISNQSQVRWGSGYRYFDQKEVLAYLISKGVLPKDWKDAFQDEMRIATTPPVAREG